MSKKRLDFPSFRYNEIKKDPPGGSSIVKVPRDVPPARVYFFGLLVYPRVYILAILIEFSLGKGMVFGNFGQRDFKIR